MTDNSYIVQEDVQCEIISDQEVTIDEVYPAESEMRSCKTLSIGEILDLPAFNNIKYGRR